jgi:hypothetical protein
MTAFYMANPSNVAIAAIFEGSRQVGRVKKGKQPRRPAERKEVAFRQIGSARETSCSTSLLGTSFCTYLLLCFHVRACSNTALAGISFVFAM